MSRPSFVACFVPFLLSSSVLAAQFTETGGCQPNWQPTFGGTPGISPGAVRSATIFDDGTGGGPELYVGGRGSVAGTVLALRIARWNGSSWSPLGTGISGDSPSPTGSGGATVNALVVFDDGSGSALYAGGLFSSAGGTPASCIARWNGSSWSPLGTGISGSVALEPPRIHALTVFDDGGGPALYAAGSFTSAGGVGANHVARWNGSSWSSLGSGVNAPVFALAAFDDGSGGGPALYAGGSFTSAGGVAASHVARWNGSSWTSLGANGLDGDALALTTFDDGSGGGPALYAGGSFQTAGGVAARNIARWNGASWSALGSGVSSPVMALAVFDAGNGPTLHAGGVNRVVRWNGASWSNLGGVNGPVNALTVFDDGSRETLCAGGELEDMGGVAASGVAAWDGSSWSRLGNEGGVNKAVRAMVASDAVGPGGKALYVGGEFTMVGDASINRIARWDGSSWSPLGSGLDDTVHSLAIFDDGAGPALYASGWFLTAGGHGAKRIARWDGSSWSNLGSGLLGGVLPTAYALAVFDDGGGGGPALYAGGSFSSAGGLAVNNIARWNGSTWSALGSGLNDRVLALIVYDAAGSAGPVLVAGGLFTTAGGVPASRIAQWNGTSWSPLGSGTDGAVSAFTLGPGSVLYAGGYFTRAGSASVGHIARWNGSSWSRLLGGGAGGPVLALRFFTSVSGVAPDLYAAGRFQGFINAWNGTRTSFLGGGLEYSPSPYNSEAIQALEVFDDEGQAGPALFAGGSFRTAPHGDRYLLRWQGCVDTSPPTLSCPTSIEELDAFSGPAGETVFFTVTASDESDPDPVVVCTPPSGSFFPRGTTLVTCTATDASGNQSTCAFPVSVRLKARPR